MHGTCLQAHMDRSDSARDADLPLTRAPLERRSSRRAAWARRRWAAKSPWRSASSVQAVVRSSASYGVCPAAAHYCPRHGGLAATAPLEVPRRVLSPSRNCPCRGFGIATSRTHGASLEGSKHGAGGPRSSHRNIPRAAAPACSPCRLRQWASCVLFVSFGRSDISAAVGGSPAKSWPMISAPSLLLPTCHGAPNSLALPTSRRGPC